MAQGYRYTKPLSGNRSRYAPIVDWHNISTIFELIVTMGDMDTDDAFHVTLPGIGNQATVGELLDIVFPNLIQHEDYVRTRLDLKVNPDLPEIYDALLDVFHTWRDSRCDLNIYLNHGPEMNLSDTAVGQLRMPVYKSVSNSSTPVLDIVIEQRFTPLKYATLRSTVYTAEELLQWLQEHTLLYLMDTHGFELQSTTKSISNLRLLPIAHRMLDKNLIWETSDPTGYTITDVGQQVLTDMAKQADSFAHKYELFEDVVYDSESGTVEFETGNGSDLRIAVYEAEGLDPLMAVFVQLLTEGILDNYPNDWQESIQDKAFFDHMLVSIADRDIPNHTSLDAIIDAGLSELDERQEQADRRRQFRKASNPTSMS